MELLPQSLNPVYSSDWSWCVVEMAMVMRILRILEAAKIMNEAKKQAGS
jgi:hypothetical protein